LTIGAKPFCELAKGRLDWPSESRRPVRSDRSEADREAGKRLVLNELATVMTVGAVLDLQAPVVEATGEGRSERTEIRRRQPGKFGEGGAPTEVAAAKC